MAAPLAPPRPAPAGPESVRQPVEHPAPVQAAAGGLVLEPGQRIAKKYVLDRPAGFGGMAQLWVATNESTGAEVCVKLLVPDPEKDGQDEEAVERFRREAHAAARLSHRAIVRVFDLLELDDEGEAIRQSGDRTPHAYAIVMELLHGETLGDMLAKRGKLPLEEALDLFLPIASALGHAHRADVIHRDLKPDNIFLAREPDGHVIPKVLDFGVSKVVSASAITIDGVLVGTPCFMSPEQARGSRDIDARSDVFSAGILLYMMLSGRNPFEDAPTFAAVVDAVLRREVTPLPDVPPPIWAVIERAIAKDPAARFDGATEMNIALRKAAGRRAPTESDPGLPVASSSGPRPIAASLEPPAPEPIGDAGSSDAARRRRTIVAAVVGVAAALILTAALLAALGPRPGTDTSARVPEPATTGTPESSAGSEPPATTSAATVTPATTETEPPPSEPAPAAVPVKAAATPARASAPRRAPSTSTPAATPSRKPGQEPHKARDPGF